MSQHAERLRVALVVGALSQGGAEKQFVYMARSLLESGIDVKIYSLAREGYHLHRLGPLGLQPIWIGQMPLPPLRILALVAALRRFNPHIVQSTHFFSNLYAGAAGRLLNVSSIGAMRSNLRNSTRSGGIWTRWLVKGTSALLANSQTARREVVQGNLISPRRIRVLPNVLDVDGFDQESAPMKDRGESDADPRRVRVIFVGRLMPVKRVDRLLRALAIARSEVPELTVLIVGDGPERERLAALAADLSLLPEGVEFAGRRDDIPALLRQSQVLVLTSDDEGFPNVLLEAMAARLPVLTTPAGDAGIVVQDGVTGCVVPFNDIQGMARNLVRLARSPDLRRQYGEAGRRRVEDYYSYHGLRDQLLAIYREVAELQNDQRVLRALQLAARVG